MNDTRVVQDAFYIGFGHILATKCADTLHAAERGYGTGDKSALAFARFLKATRKNAGLSIAELAEKAIVSEAELIALEKGLITSRKIHHLTLNRLAKALNKDLKVFNQLLGYTIPQPSFEGTPAHIKNAKADATSYFGLTRNLTIALILVITTLIGAVFFILWNLGFSIPISDGSTHTVAFPHPVNNSKNLYLLPLTITLTITLLFIFIWFSIYDESPLTIRYIDLKIQRKLVFKTLITLLVLFSFLPSLLGHSSFDIKSQSLDGVNPYSLVSDIDEVGIAAYYPTTLNSDFIDFDNLEEAHSINVADVDSDGDLDIAGANGSIWAGFSDGTYSPIDRIALVDILMDINGDGLYDLITPTGVYFTDVPNTHLYLEYISEVYETGLVQGNHEAHFYPFSPPNAIVRAEAATIFVRAIEGEDFNWVTYEYNPSGQITLPYPQEKNTTDFTYAGKVHLHIELDDVYTAPGALPFANEHTISYFDNNDYGQILFESDRLLKTYTLGADNLSSQVAMNMSSFHDSAYSTLSSRLAIDFEPNNFSNIPLEIGKLSNLTQLSLMSNSITHVIFSRSSLESIYLDSLSENMIVDTQNNHDAIMIPVNHGLSFNQQGGKRYHLLGFAFSQSILITTLVILMISVILREGRFISSYKRNTQHK